MPSGGGQRDYACSAPDHLTKNEIDFAMGVFDKALIQADAETKK